MELSHVSHIGVVTMVWNILPTLGSCLGSLSAYVSYMSGNVWDTYQLYQYPHLVTCWRVLVNKNNQHIYNIYKFIEI